jgi:hypothetical protein
MKFSWLATLGTAVFLTAGPVLSQDDFSGDDLPAVESDGALEPTPTEDFSNPQDTNLPENTDNDTPPDSDPPAPEETIFGPEPGTEGDYTEQPEAEDYNVIPHIPDDCSDIRVFSARGSDEPYPGRGGAMLGIMCQLFEATGVSCDYEDVVYPANISYSGIYCQSANAGAYAGAGQMSGYIQRCPDSRIVMLGYSQGANVVEDILGGGGGYLFGCQQDANPALSRSTAPGSHSESLQV